MVCFVYKTIRQVQNDNEEKLNFVYTTHVFYVSMCLLKCLESGLEHFGIHQNIVVNQSDLL